MPVEVRKVAIGQGSPKIVVPVMGNDVSAVLGQVASALEWQADIVEWRADYFEALHDEKQLAACLHAIRDALEDVPLLFTVRSQHQGGHCNADQASIAHVIRRALESGCIDMADIEFDLLPETLKDLVEHAHAQGCIAVVSSHDFKDTPGQDEIYTCYQAQLDAGADICKVAVMGKAEGDELRLMAATSQFAQDHPDAVLVGISMGEVGVITRLAGEFFGSTLTFCSNGASSAPGQVDARLARSLIDQLHAQASSAG